MCGISGALGPGVDPAIVARMSAALSHRGPDDSGLEGGPTWGLGHRRLAILDLSDTGHQPMASPDGRFRIVYNGQMFNYVTQRGVLERDHGWVFHGRSDTEVILALCAIFGTAAVDRIEGMYAFVIYDLKTNTAWGARDPYGIKPLYHCMQGSTLLFASEISAIKAGLGRMPLSDEARLAFVVTGYVPAPATALSGIESLMPGHLLVWNGHSASVRPSSGLHPAHRPRALVPAGARPKDAPASTIRALVTEAVTSHLVADVPVGAFLSGGIDSAIVVGVMAQHAARPVPTFTLRFDLGGPHLDEGEAARRWAHHWHTDHHESIITGNDVVLALPDFFRRQDQPSTDGLNTFLVCREASASVKVALSGLGGDELFGGYHTHRFAITAKRLTPLGLALARMTRSLPERLPASLQRHALARAWMAAGEATWTERYLRLRRLAPDDITRSLLASPLDGLAAGDLLASSLVQVLDSAPLDPEQLVYRLETSLYMANQLLRDSDALSMAHGLELRVPFLAEGLRQFIGSDAVPSARGGGKRLLREAFADWPWPASHRKRGFTLPLALWARHNASFKAWLTDVLSPDRLRRRDRWDSSAVNNLLRAFFECPPAEAGARFAPLWAIASYEAWGLEHGD